MPPPPPSASASFEATVDLDSRLVDEAPTEFPVALMLEQQFDGSFLPSASLLSILGQNLQALQANIDPKLSQLPSELALQLWTSIVVLALLKQRWGSFEASWQMSAEKTRTWCLQTLSKHLKLDRVAARHQLEQFILQI